MRAFFSAQLRARGLRLADAGVARMLHAEYKTLPPENKRAYTEKGRRATARWRANDDKNKSAFGKRWARRDRRRAEVALRLACWRRCEALPVEERCFALMQRVVAVSPVDSKGFAKSMSDARGIDRAQRQLAQQQKAATHKELLTWQNTTGQAQLQRLAESFRGAEAELLSKLMPVPGPRVDMYSASTTDAQRAIAATAHVLSNQKGLRQVVAEDWARRHALVMEADARPLKAEDAGPPSPCVAAGMCICSGAGRLIHQLRSAFVRALKGAIPHMSKLREQAKQGFLVCRFRSPPVEVSAMSSREQQDNPGPCDIWLHLGALGLSPFKCTFQRMTLTELEEPNRGRQGGGLRAHLRATGEPLTDYEAMTLLRPESAWELGFFWLDNAMRSLSRCFPGEVVASPSACASVKFWPTLRKQVACGSKRHACGRSGWKPTENRQHRAQTHSDVGITESIPHSFFLGNRMHHVFVDMQRRHACGCMESLSSRL